jgi:hypothetical protein
VKVQNAAHHARYVPLYHFVTGTLAIAVMIGSFVNLCASLGNAERLSSASLLAAVSLIILSVLWYARVFSLRAQDRAIRAEENLRHFSLTGKLLDPRLRMGQVVSLRFAPDEELVALAKRAAEENLSKRAIEEAITNWRADNHRV